MGAPWPPKQNGRSSDLPFSIFRFPSRAVCAAGIRLLLLAAASHGADGTEAGQHHGVAFGLRNRGGQGNHARVTGDGGLQRQRAIEVDVAEVRESTAHDAGVALCTGAVPVVVVERDRIAGALATRTRRPGTAQVETELRIRVFRTASQAIVTDRILRGSSPIGRHDQDRVCAQQEVGRVPVVGNLSGCAVAGVAARGRAVGRTARRHRRKGAGVGAGAVERGGIVANDGGIGSGCAEVLRRRLGSGRSHTRLGVAAAIGAGVRIVEADVGAHRAGSRAAIDEREVRRERVQRIEVNQLERDVGEGCRRRRHRVSGRCADDHHGGQGGKA